MLTEEETKNGNVGWFLVWSLLGPTGRKVTVETA